MIGFPFDSHVTYDDNGTPVYDRAVTSAPYRAMLKKLFNTGVLPTDSTQFQVSAGEGMTVSVASGFAIVEGCMKLEEETRTLAIQESDSAYDRIDTVVLRLDTNDDVRICDLYVLEGTPASTPVRPSLTRSSSVYELGLADVFISKGDTQISDDKITDTRYESARCGVLSSISEMDTTTIYKQVQADLEKFQAVNEADFVAWVEELKKKLDESTAGHLQTEIDAINTTLGDTDISELGDTITSAISAETTRAKSAESTLTSTISASSIPSTLGDTVGGAIAQLNSDLTVHKSSGDHDGRYYTEAEVNSLLSAKQDASTAITTSNISSQTVSSTLCYHNSGDWRSATGFHAFIYEGTGTNYGLPCLHCGVFVMSIGNRGVAIAIQWNLNNSNVQRNCATWVNHLHDSWGSWHRICNGVDTEAKSSNICTTLSMLSLSATSQIFTYNVDNTGYIPIVASGFVTGSSRLIKKNIENITDEEALKILDVRVVTYDELEGFGNKTDCRGVIAEEIQDVIPSCVTVPEGYDESEFDASKGVAENKILGVDYAKLVPYLIKTVQIHQKEINELREKVDTLSNGAS